MNIVIILGANQRSDLCIASAKGLNVNVKWMLITRC